MQACRIFLVVLCLTVPLEWLACSPKLEEEKMLEPYTKEQKADIRQDMMRDVRRKLKEYDEKIARLESEQDKMNQETNPEATETISDLRQKKDEAQTQLEKLENAGEDAWEDIRSDLEAAMEDLEKAYNGATTAGKSE